MLDWHHSMFGWLKSKIVPLEGAPAVRRQKTYQSQTGYVYQYYFEGSRPASSMLGGGYEFVFRVTADRKTEFPVSIHVGQKGIDAWQKLHGRELLSKERYAVAKLALFEAFDLSPDPTTLRLPVHADAVSVEKFLARLGRD